MPQITCYCIKMKYDTVIALPPHWKYLTITPLILILGMREYQISVPVFIRIVYNYLPPRGTYFLNIPELIFSEKRNDMWFEQSCSRESEV